VLRRVGEISGNFIIPESGLLEEILDKIIAVGADTSSGHGIKRLAEDFKVFIVF